MTVYPINEIAIVGKNAKEKAMAINTLFIPNKMMMAIEKENHAFPLLKDTLVGNNTYIYLCKDYTCSQPVETIEAFTQLVN